MTGAELKTIRESLGLPQSWLAATFECSLRIVQLWEKGTHPVPEDAARFMLQVREHTEKIVADSVKFLVEQGEEIFLYRYTTDEAFHAASSADEMPESWNGVVTHEVQRELRKRGVRASIVYWRE